MSNEQIPKISSNRFAGNNSMRRLHRNNQMVYGINNIVAATAEQIFIVGNSNVIGDRAQNVTLLNSSGCTVVGGLVNVSIYNTSGATVTESNTKVEQGIIVFSPSRPSGKSKRYRALITQSGTNAPQEIILEDTIGTTGNTVVWTRVIVAGDPNYIGTLDGAFTANKTFLPAIGMNGSTALGGSMKWTNANVISIKGLADGDLVGASIEIIVYS